MSADKKILDATIQEYVDQQMTALDASISHASAEMLDKLGEALLLKRKTLEGGQIESDHSYRERLKQICFGMPQLTKDGQNE